MENLITFTYTWNSFITALREDFIINVIGVLMNNSVNREVGGISFDLLNSVIIDSLNDIRVALYGNSTSDSVNLEDVITNFFREGISRFYFDLHYPGQHSLNTTICGTNQLFAVLFPQVEQDKISMLVDNLRQMGDIFQLVRNVSLTINNMQVVCLLQWFTYTGS